MVRILVLDDEKGIRDIISKNLSSRGFEVVTVATGEEVLEKIREGETFDCAVFDVNNDKGMGAIPTMKEIKKIAPNLKVIVMSDSTHLAVREPSRFDFAASLAKPFDIQMLIDVINKVLS